MVKRIFLIFIFISLISFADVKVSAFFSSEKAGTEDVLDFIIKIEGEGEAAETPYLSSNQDFQVLSGPSISTSVQIVNFNMKKSIEYRWKINPKREGALTMPSLEIKIGKNIYKTNEAKLQVEKGSLLQKQRRQTPSIFDDFFEEPRRVPQREAEIRVQAVPNKTECFVGEPVVITYNLLTQASIQNISLMEPPTYDGFWVENIEIPERPEAKNVEIDGKQFYSYTIKKDLLFPNSEGIKIIKEVSFQIQAIISRDFFGFPQVGNVLRKTNPININVKPLPEAGTKNFQGAVGKFEISSKVDKLEVVEGEAFTLTLKISGKGNFKNIKDFEVKDIPLCKIYPPKIEEKLKATSEGYEGYKIWEWVIVPEEKQSLKIPEFIFTYFDPYKKSFNEIKTKSLSIFIKKGKEKKEEKIFMAEGKEIKEIARDIGYIVVDGKNLEKKVKKSSYIYYLLIFPPLLNIALFLIKKFKQRGLSEKEKWERKAKNYFKKAKEFLDKKKEEDFVKNLEKALKVAVSGVEDLTMEEFKEKIAPLSEEEKTGILNFLSNLQDFRFNPLFKNKKSLEEIEKEGSIWFQRLKNL